VDTCGAVSWRVLERIRPFTDLFLYDLKHMDETSHKKATGAPNRRILKNLEKLSQLGHAIRLRFAVVPGINDSEQNVQRTGEFIAALPGRHAVSLLPFHAAAEDKYKKLGHSYTLMDTDPPGEQQMSAIAAVLEGYGLEVTKGG